VTHSLSIKYTRNVPGVSIRNYKLKMSSGVLPCVTVQLFLPDNDNENDDYFTLVTSNSLIDKYRT